MAKSDRKLHEARMAGAIWIMKLIEDKGIDEARKELATRRAMHRKENAQHADRGRS